MSKRLVIWLVAVGALLGAAGWYWSRSTAPRPLTVAISPYQDLAMLVNIHHLGLPERFRTPVNILTIPWEETYPTILSARSPVDVAFSSFADFLARYQNVNARASDPLLFLYPAYIFKGGSFVSFRPNAVQLTAETLSNPELVNRFLNQRIALQRSTLYEMIIIHLARSVGRNPSTLNIVDVGFDAGFLAAVNGDVDVAAVGLTQLTEGLRRGGQVVLNMDQLGFSDITGFIVRQSVWRARQSEIENLIRMWFVAVDYVMSDIDRNSAVSLAYLARTAATRYTLDSYKQALEQEFFPRSPEEVQNFIIQNGSRYDVQSIYNIISNFISVNNRGSFVPPIPQFISISSQ